MVSWGRIILKRQQRQDDRQIQVIYQPGRILT